MSSPTIKDVAKLAGVSISTVSRVMNNSKPVSPEARRRVLDAIKKLDFKPNQLARSLVMKKSNIIGVIVKDIGIDYMTQTIRGIEEIGRMYNYDIMLSSTYGDIDVGKKSIDFMVTKQVEGIIVLSEDMNPEIVVKLKDHKIPYIHLDRYYNLNEFNTVTIDYHQASAAMTEFLFKLGHTKILYLNGHRESKLGKDKLAGYRETMKDHGLKAYHIDTGGRSADIGYNVGDKVREMMKKEGITAVYASDDELGIGFINYCYDKSIDVPEELSVVGFGDAPIASVYRPRLTTIQVPNYDIGAVAMRRLVKQLAEGKVTVETSYLPVQIMERESSAKI